MLMDAVKPELPHTVVIDNRNSISLTGITDIGSFNEETVLLTTPLGELNITGAQMQVTKLDLESGDVTIEGKIISLTYADTVRKNTGFFARVFG